MTRKSRRAQESTLGIVFFLGVMDQAMDWMKSPDV
jgi:hypothetical protein